MVAMAKITYRGRRREDENGGGGIACDPLSGTSVDEGARELARSLLPSARSKNSKNRNLFSSCDIVLVCMH